jgi:hypothetical protein
MQSAFVSVAPCIIRLTIGVTTAGLATDRNVPQHLEENGQLKCEVSFDAVGGGTTATVPIFQLDQVISQVPCNFNQRKIVLPRGGPRRAPGKIGYVRH